MNETPKVRLEAAYPATDGSAPESISIEWEGVEVSGGELAVLVEALARVPRRYEMKAADDAN